MVVAQIFRERPKMNRKAFLVLLIAIGVLTFWIGHTWTRILEHVFPPPIIADTAIQDHREETFLAIVDDWKAYLAAKEGYVDGDPYRGILESNPHVSFDALRDVHFVPYLPVRLNTVLSKNPKYVVFSYFPWELGGDVEWKYYADGTWSKVFLANRSKLEAATPDGDTWVHDFPKTGFPNWTSIEARNAWVAKNRAQIQWDTQLREYVHRPSGS
jgi:hypothetical protein